VAGIPAFAFLRAVDHLAGDSDAAMRTIAVVVLVAAGTYQLTPLKARCLRHCRSPLAQLLHFGNFKGRGVDLKVAFHHAGYCLGCCWALMLLFAAFGIMSVWTMIGLAVVVFAEKFGRHGETLARSIGVACFLLAALVAVSPNVAHELIPTSDMPAMTNRM
jgi:predicted metal-binding membrane protein